LSPTFYLGSKLDIKIATEKVIYKGTKREQVKTTVETKPFMSEVTYTPDRTIIWNSKAKNIFYTDLDEYLVGKVHKAPILLADLNSKLEMVSYVDVKAPPGYGNRHGSDVSFSIKSKWIWESYSAYINKVYNFPNKKVANIQPYLWLKTFTPKRYLYSDKLVKLRTIKNWVPKTLEQFLGL